MPIVFSKAGTSASPDEIPWIEDYVYLVETGRLTTSIRDLGFKAYIPSTSNLLALTPVEYLAYYRSVNTALVERTRAANEDLVRQALKMTSPAPPPAPPSVHVTNPENTSTRPALTTRRSASLHKNVITKLRPLPFQYVWAVWHDKAYSPSTITTITTTAAAAATSTSTSTSDNANSTSFSDRLTLLAEHVPDIGAFYRIYNNFPWESLRLMDSVHVFRAGVRPLWEDPENLDGGAWTVKVRREDGRAVKVWEEICLMGCGGELQAAIAPERDHVLGMSYSPRLYWAHITVWTKKGSNADSVETLEHTILDRLSPELRPKSAAEYYYKKHSDHEGWTEAVGAAARKGEAG